MKRFTDCRDTSDHSRDEVFCGLPDKPDHSRDA